MNRWMRLVTFGVAMVGLVAATACSDDDNSVDSAVPVPDAGRQDAAPDIAETNDVGVDTTPAHQPNFTCASENFPDTAPDSVTISGQARTSAGMPIVATVEVRDVDGDALLDSMTTAADGQYTLTVATGGVPKMVYFHVVADGYVDTYRYFGYPLTGSTTSSQRVWTASEVQTYAATGGIVPTTGKGHIRINTRDCDLKLTQAGSVISTTPAAPSLVYETGPDCNALDTTLSQSTACTHVTAYDLDPGAVTIEAVRGDTSFRSQVVKVAADGMTWVTMQPARP